MIAYVPGPRGDVSTPARYQVANDVPLPTIRPMPVKWGILSTARINQLFLAGVRESTEVEVVAVASRTRDATMQSAKRRAIEALHESAGTIRAVAL